MCIRDRLDNRSSENENNEVTDDNINNEGVSTSGNYNEEIITNKNQVMNYKLSGGVTISKDYNDSEIILNEYNGDTLSNSGDKENESVKSVEVSHGVLVSVIELEREYEES